MSAQLFTRAAELAQPFLLLGNTSQRRVLNRDQRAQLEDAIALCDKVLLADPQNWSAAWLAGKATQSLGDQERAYCYFGRSFEVQNENADVARELTIACLETKRAKRAVEIAEHAVRLEPKDPGLKANLALAQLCSGDLAGAEATIDTALIGDPHDQTSISLKRLIFKVRLGQIKAPETPADLLK